MYRPVAVATLLALGAVAPNAHAKPKPPAEVVGLERTDQGVAGYALRLRDTVGLFTPTVLGAAMAGHGYPGLQRLFVGDVDGDRRGDVITLEGLSGAGTKDVVAHNNGDGTFTRHGIPTGMGSRPPRVVAAGDVDGDGRADLVEVKYHGQTADYVVAYATMCGTFRRIRAKGATGVPFPREHVNVADFDGDGRADILSTEGEPGERQQYVLAHTNPYGTFTRRLVGSLPLAFATAAGDVNGDGRADIVTAAPAPDAFPGPSTAFYSVWLSQADGSLRHVPARGADGPFAKTIVAADVNGDGRADIVSAEDSQYVAALTNADGTFSRVQLGTVPGYPIDVAAGDIDGR